MTYRRAKAATNFSFAVGVSSNLVTWNSGAAFVDESVSADDGTNETRVAQDKATIDSKPVGFLRLKVNRKIQGAKVVCFGDSITLGYGVPATQTWVNQLTARFNLDTVNAGVSGNTSSQGLARIQNDVLAIRPDFVIINFGMNDHVMTALDTPTVSKTTFRTNLMTTIDRVRTNNAIPILVTVNYIIEGDASQYYYNRHPANYYANVGGAQAWLDSYIQIVRDVAAQKSVDLVDVRAGCNSHDRYDFLRSLTNAANDDDGVHPYLTGSNVYQQLIGDYLAAHY
jgi:lysophospholipase L1-like esterase